MELASRAAVEPTSLGPCPRSSACKANNPRHSKGAHKPRFPANTHFYHHAAVLTSQVIPGMVETPLSLCPQREIQQQQQYWQQQGASNTRSTSSNDREQVTFWQRQWRIESVILIQLEAAQLRQAKNTSAKLPSNTITLHLHQWTDHPSRPTRRQ